MCASYRLIYSTFRVVRRFHIAALTMSLYTAPEYNSKPTSVVSPPLGNTAQFTVTSKVPRTLTERNTFLFRFFSTEPKLNSK